MIGARLCWDRSHHSQGNSNRLITSKLKLFADSQFVTMYVESKHRSEAPMHVVTGTADSIPLVKLIVALDLQTRLRPIFTSSAGPVFYTVNLPCYAFSI